LYYAERKTITAAGEQGERKGKRERDGKSPYFLNVVNILQYKLHSEKSDKNQRERETFNRESAVYNLEDSRQRLPEPRLILFLNVCQQRSI